MTNYDKYVVRKFAQWLCEQNLLYSVDVDYDWDEEPYEIITSVDPMTVAEDYIMESENE